MKIACRFGHNEQAQGAVGILNEVTEDRKYGSATVKYLLLGGAEVLDVTPGPCDQYTDLKYGVDRANAWGADLFLSFHVDSFKYTDGERGSETLILGTGGQAEIYAKRIEHNVAGLGFLDRGVKVRTNLYELNQTDMAAIIIEPFFLDAKGDVDKYLSIGPDRIGKRIAEAVLNKAIYDPALVAIPAPIKSGTAVVYGNEVDQMACKYVHWVLGGDEKGIKLMDGNIPTDYSKFTRVICIGGIPPYFGRWTSYATDKVAIGDRVDTLYAALKLAGR